MITSSSREQVSARMGHRRRNDHNAEWIVRLQAVRRIPALPAGRTASAIRLSARRPGALAQLVLPVVHDDQLFARIDSFQENQALPVRRDIVVRVGG